MKTRNLLLAMALPTLFAACTAEEIVSQADNNVSLENRALLGDLTAKIENSVESRVSWDEANRKWGAWEESDVFSAALVDATPGTVANNLLTNYVFSKTEGGWSTTSQMVEGIYSFYSYKGIKDKNDRKPVAFDLRNQKANLNEPTKVLDDYQLFFSPLYKIEAKNTTAENNIDLPLEFYPYHSAGMFYIKNNTGENLKISQIILKGSFGAKGEVQPTKIDGEHFRYEVRTWKGVSETEYKLVPKTPRTETADAVEYTSDEIKEMWEASVLDNASVTPVQQIVLDCGKWTLANGKEVKAYMNVPAGMQTALEVEINVIDEEGNAKTIYINDNGVDGDTNTDTEGISSTNISKTGFKRGTATAIFGLNSGAPKAVNVKKENLSDAKGIYVDNEDDLIKLINEGRGNMSVYNAEGLKINAKIAKELAKNTACELTFENEIVIEDFAETVNLTNVKFAKAVTVKAEYDANGTATERGTTVVLGSGIDVNAGITIEKYTTATLNNGTYNAVTNNGTLTVYALVADADNITNTGTLTVDNDAAPQTTTTNTTAHIPAITTTGAVTIKGMNPTVNFNGGSLSYEAKKNASSQNIPFDVTGIVAGTGADLSLTIGADVTLKNAFTLAQSYTAKTTSADAKYLSVEVEEDGNWLVDVPSYVGKLTNEGKVYTTTGVTSHLAILSESENDGEITVDALDVVKDAELTNNGYILSARRAANNGTIINNSGAYLKLTHALGLIPDGTFNNVVATSEGRIENYGAFEYSDNTVLASQEIYCVLNNKSIADVEALNIDRYYYNTIQITGTFSASRDFGAAASAANKPALMTKLANIKNIELNGATLDMSSATTDINMSFNELRIMGNVTMKGFTSAASKLVVWDKANNNENIVMAKSASLTVKNMTISGVNTIVAPTLTANDKVTDATYGDYWSAAAKVYNKGVIDLTTAPTVFTTKSATATTNNLYWEGTAAQ